MKISQNKLAYMFILTLFLSATRVFDSAWADDTSTAIANTSSDIILVIESSSKIKVLDPLHIRKQANKRLISLLDRTDRVGIVTFSENAHPVLPLTPVDAAHINDIYSALDTLTAHGKTTNWYDALTTTRDLINNTSDSTTARTTHVILISVDPFRLKQKTEPRHPNPHIEGELIPWFKANKISIHTVTLSNANIEPMFNKLAEQTGGKSEFIKNADALSNSLDTFLNVIKHRRTIPANNGEFTIAQGVESFYLLNQPLHGESNYLPVSLTDPAGNHISYTSASASYIWTRDKNFETISVTSPIAGKWLLSHDSGTENYNGITLYTPDTADVINIQYRCTPELMHTGDNITCVAWLEKDGIAVTDSALNHFLKAQLQVIYQDQTSQYISLLPMKTQSGKFSSTFMLNQPGDTRFVLSLHDNNFVREITFNTSVIATESADIGKPEGSVAQPKTNPDVAVPEAIVQPRVATHQFTPQELALMIICALNLIIIIIGLVHYYNKRRMHSFFMRGPVKQTPKPSNETKFSFQPTQKTI